MIRTAVGHHYKFEFVLWLESRSPACKASMLTTPPTVPTSSSKSSILSSWLVAWLWAYAFTFPFLFAVALKHLSGVSVKMAHFVSCCSLLFSFVVVLSEMVLKSLVIYQDSLVYSHEETLQVSTAFGWKWCFCSSQHYNVLQHLFLPKINEYCSCYGITLPWFLFYSWNFTSVNFGMHLESIIKHYDD